MCRGHQRFSGRFVAGGLRSCLGRPSGGGVRGERSCVRPVRVQLEETRGDLDRVAEELEEERQRDTVDGPQFVAAGDVIGARPVVVGTWRR